MYSVQCIRTQNVAHYSYIPSIVMFVDDEEEGIAVFCLALSLNS